MKQNLSCSSNWSDAVILKCEREHKHGNKLQNARGTDSSITEDGQIPFHFRRWDTGLIPSLLLIRCKRVAVTTAGVVSNHEAAVWQTWLTCDWMRHHATSCKASKTADYDNMGENKERVLVDQALQHPHEPQFVARLLSVSFCISSLKSLFRLWTTWVFTKGQSLLK